MKTFIKLASIVAVAAALVQTIQATPIVGNIGFTGRATYDTGSAGTATTVVSWTNTVVNGTTGSFTSLPSGTNVTFAAPWSFNSGLVNSFWSVGGFTFKLLSSWIVFQGSGSVIVNGTGIVSASGYDDTVLAWSFTSQDPAVTSNPTTFTFSASGNSVPDGATTATLLGIALSGAALLKRKLTA